MQGLRQFFSFFGSKVALAKHYPAPQHDKIVEPFAGSAGYACLYPDREVYLYDLDPVVVGVWQYLIAATEKDILSLPLDVAGVKGLSRAEQDFVGFWWRRCGATPSNIPVPWALSGQYESSFWSETTRRRIAVQMHRIKHWKVEQQTFDKVRNRKATWFIDPPYAIAGKRYKHGSTAINYEKLAAWCQSRRGQKIVCEDASATWLQFLPLYENRTVKYKKVKRTIVEGMYYEVIGDGRWDV